MSSVLVEPLGSPNIVATLRGFIDLLSSSQGPKAGLKIMITGGGIALVTSSSSRIVRNLSIEDPVCLYISQVVKAQIERCNDLGLYAGVLTGSVVERVLSCDMKLEVSGASRIIQRVLSKLKQCLEMSGIKIQVDFSSVRQMLCIVRSILSTKPACSLKKEECGSLAASIVKGFLGIVDSDIGQMIVMSGSGASVDSCVYHGILYQVTDETLLCGYNDGDLTLLLFNIMLTDKQKDNEINTSRCVKIVNANIKWENILADTLLVLDEAVKQNVKIVACQKVVHESLQIYLRRKGILLLDRLGTAATKALERLSGAVPIASIGTEVANTLDTLLGRVDSVRLVEHDGKPYLCLERAESNIVTLFINAVSEEATAELQVVVKQCISALHQLLVEPFVLPGAGCLEMWLSASLQQVLDDSSTYNCSRGQLTTALRVVQRAMLSAAGLKLSLSLPVAVDSVYRHAWLDNKTLCCCQMVSASDVNSRGGSFYDVMCANEEKFLPEFKWFHPELIFANEIGENYNVDLYYSKVSALNAAFESAVNLLNIGLVIQK